MSSYSLKPSRFFLLLLPSLLAVLVAACSGGDNDAPKAPTAEAEPSAAPEGEGAAEWGVTLDDVNRTMRAHPAPKNAPRNLAEEIERLEAIGYLDGSELAPSVVNVTLHDRQRAYAGYNLYCSGHAPEAVLMDMEGRVLHRWGMSFLEVWPNRTDRYNNRGARYWRRLYLYPNGDLVAIFEGAGIIKLDKDSNLLWENATLAHHDVVLLPDGNLLTLTRKAHMVPAVNRRRPIMEDYGIVLDSQGQIIKQVSLLDALQNSEYYHFFKDHPRKAQDIFHTNTISLLDGTAEERNPAFGAGNWLVSLRNINTVAVVDPQATKVVWAKKGPYQAQHDPRILENGNMLVFNNAPRHRKSTVMEMDIKTEEIVWKYEGTREHPFFTPTCGAAYRLPNGNTLICESDSGRAFEVTPDKEIVWEFFNPHRAGENDEFIATLFDVKRYSFDYPEWLDGGGSGAAQ